MFDIVCLLGNEHMIDRRCWRRLRMGGACERRARNARKNVPIRCLHAAKQLERNAGTASEFIINYTFILIFTSL